jgi:hypothetical protein
MRRRSQGRSVLDATEHTDAVDLALPVSSDPSARRAGARAASDPAPLRHHRFQKRGAASLAPSVPRRHRSTPRTLADRRGKYYGAGSLHSTLKVQGRHEPGVRLPVANGPRLHTRAGSHRRAFRPQTWNVGAMLISVRSFGLRRTFQPNALQLVAFVTLTPSA